jgi:HD-like signal output (HDOD) protein
MDQERDMNEKAARKLLARIESGSSLPSLSAVAVQLVEVAADETASAEDLAALIENDPSLAVRLLKLANSAFFSAGRPVASLKQAVVKVGFQRLRVMALSLSLRATFPMGRRGGMDYERFWRTSLYRALLARSLADRTGLCNPEEAFVGGLILEVGLLVFHDLASGGEGRAELDYPSDLEVLETILPWERELLGLDHRIVGEAALRHWRFPQSLISCQAAYGDAAFSEDQTGLVRIVEFSRQLARDLAHRTSNPLRLFERGERDFGIRPEGLGDILAGTFEQVEDMAQSLSLELDRERDLLSVMEKANQALVEMSEEMQEHLPTLDRISRDAGSIRTLEAVAHEIRNPLTAVGGFARRLANAMEPSSEGGRYARVILEETTRLEDVLARMVSR